MSTMLQILRGEEHADEARQVGVREIAELSVFMVSAQNQVQVQPGEAHKETPQPGEDCLLLTSGGEKTFWM
ncbi:UNVERIFIED_CONTAM: hypothetical protein PYX00_001500 [Menopon gallinae]|uniref:Uncharacterized protein n=1 Tax=Menopon gallinae TaxID=328185 RepID=A0AAW2ID90_9NEOP